jgi:hypothetical protein
MSHAERSLDVDGPILVRRRQDRRPPTPSQYAACAALTQPVRGDSPERCCRTVVSPMPSSYAAAATEPARM